MRTLFNPNCILDHLFEYLPRITDRFSVNGLVSAEILAGDPQILRVSDPAHGLSVGSTVVLVDGVINDSITAVELFTDIEGSFLRFTVSNEHDLTLDYTPTVTLSGFTDPAFNGTFDLTAVPSRFLFEISGDSLPVLNGAEVLQEEWENGLDGVFQVDRIIDTDIYEIDLTGKPEFEPQTVPQIKRAKDFRIGITIDAKTAEAIYQAPTNPNDLWLYVIMGDCGASKDIKVKNDAINMVTAQNPSRVTMINTFSLVIFFNTTKDQTGGFASNIAWDELLKIMYAVGSGIKFDDFGNSTFVTTLIDHGSAVVRSAFYSHAYTFEYNYQVTQEEGFLTQFIESRAFRDNALSFTEEEEGSTIDLDDEAT